MKCSECPAKFEYPQAIWSHRVEARAVAEGWTFWDKNGPVEQLGHVRCPRCAMVARLSAAPRAHP